MKTKMKLINFRGICEKCDGIRSQIEWGTISAESAIEMLAEYIDYLQGEYNQDGVNLKEDCKNQMLFRKANKIYGHYRKWRDEQKDTLTFYLNELKNTINELESDNTDFTKDETTSLVSDLKRLYSLASTLSRICFEELGIMKKAGRKKTPKQTDEEKFETVEKYREWIRSLEAYQKAEAEGAVSDFKWNRKKGGLLCLWLVNSGISTIELDGSVSWNIADGTFVNGRGKPITCASIRSSYWAKTKG